ncbi:MAG: hypothetical protein HUJ98_15310, partial [Bacteroidaceae bacterium]|nr:hypothetical protein [Bacteroidaceae bacterium]
HNPQWKTDKKSSFWACTDWGGSLPNISEHVNYDVFRKDTITAYVNYTNNHMTDASQQSDFMFAYSEKTQGETVEDDILHLHFFHTLSKINFVDNTVDSQINSLKIVGSYNVGKVYVDKNSSVSWDDLSDTDKTMTISSFDQSMYLIPQTGTITITAVMQDNTEKTKTVNVAWQAGFEYTYRLNLASTEQATKAGNSDDCLTIECISEKKY